MKKITLSIVSLTLLLGLFGFDSNLKAQEDTQHVLELTSEKEVKLEYILFHLETCPHCRDEIKFLNTKLLPKYGDYIDLKMYEVSVDQRNKDLFRQYGEFYNVQVGSVPMAFIDGEIVAGYGTDADTGAQIVQIVENKLREMGVDVDSLVASESATIDSSGKAGYFILFGLGAVILYFVFKKK